MVATVLAEVDGGIVVILGSLSAGVSPWECAEEGVSQETGDLLLGQGKVSVPIPLHQSNGLQNKDTGSFSDPSSSEQWATKQRYRIIFRSLFIRAMGYKTKIQEYIPIPLHQSNGLQNKDTGVYSNPSSSEQ